MGRGKDSEDGIYFKDAYIKKLKAAMQDVQYLIDRDYKLESAVRFAGNHYDLTARHNQLLIRAASTKTAIVEKLSKKLDQAEVKDKWLHMDGFNTLITIETMLCEGILYRCTDSCIRDLAGMGGSYRQIPETETGIQAIAAICKQLSIAGLTIYLDQPVSNSGKLKAYILSMKAVFSCPVEVEIVRNPDVVLYDKEGVITTDTVILEKCHSWFHLHEHLLISLDSHLTVDFTEEEEDGR